MTMYGKKIVLEAGEGIRFVTREEDGTFYIKAVNNKQYVGAEHPPIPDGFEYVEGEKADGFVIRNTADGSEFTWLPVDMLEPNGTLDGENFCEKFGRRNFCNQNFSQDGYHESVNLELLASVKKYGGCYFPRYVASKENGKPVFKKDKKPWVNINYHDASAQARAYAEARDDIGSCEVCGAAWDSIMQWLIQTTKTKAEVAENSTSWGNYGNTPNPLRKVVKTGYWSEWEVNHIDGLAGNVDEWTSEQYGESRRVLRGGSYFDDGNAWPAARRYNEDPFYVCDDTGFRLLLYIK